MSKVLSYRPDIDTLRAVAVLSVVVSILKKLAAWRLSWC